MKVIWCRKRVCLFAIVCLVFLGGNILLLNSLSLSWPWNTFLTQSDSTESQSTGIKVFEKSLKEDLKTNIGLLDSEKNMDQDKKDEYVVTKPLHMNDVDSPEHKLTTLQPKDGKLSVVQGNRGDLEHKMFVETENRVSQTGGENSDTTLKLGGESKGTNSPKDATERQQTTAVLVLSCNRPGAVTRCLDQLLKYRPSAESFPIIVSQDCGHAETAEKIREYGEKIVHIQQPDLSNIPVQPPMIRYIGYYKIARHYKWALTQVFDVMKYNSVVIVEDDLDIAPDFFEYFSATRRLLEKDSSIWCVSAWNDNGKTGHIQGQDILYRSDFFPGLGWMLTKKLWDELGPKWPKGFWDDWMREPDQRRDRVCIRPEISRTKTFGKIGVSMGQFYDTYLRYIHLNDQPYPFSKTDLSYLLKENYDQFYLGKVYKAPLVDLERLENGHLSVDALRIEYSDKNEFAKIARLVGIMDDFKAGVPRTAYKGVVSTMYKGKRLYIVPPYGQWTGYRA